jgi:hypothetical protein
MGLMSGDDGADNEDGEGKGDGDGERERDADVAGVSRPGVIDPRLEEKLARDARERKPKMEGDEGSGNPSSSANRSCTSFPLLCQS